MSINALPTEVLVKIFSYLPIDQRISLRSVCKHWLSLPALNDVAEIYFIANGLWFSRDLLNAVSLTKTNVLLFSGWKFISFILKNCHNLKSISIYLLSEAHFEDDSINDLSEIGEKLATFESVCIHIAHSMPPHPSFDHMSSSYTLARNLIHLLGYCKNLSTLQLNASLMQFSIEQAEQFFERLFQRNSNLKKLVCNVDSLLLSINPEREMETLFSIVSKYSERHRESFQALHVTQSSPDDRSSVLEFKNLRELRLKIWDSTTLTVDHFKNLEVLQLNHLELDLNCSEVLRIISKSNQLKIIDYAAIVDDTVLEVISTCFPQLVHLKLNIELTNNSLNYLVQLQNLETLLIGGPFIHDISINDEAFSEFVRNLPSIRVVAVNLNAVEALLEKAILNPTKTYFGFMQYDQTIDILPSNFFLSTFGHDNIIFMYYFNNEYENNYFNWKNIPIRKQ